MPFVLNVIHLPIISDCLFKHFTFHLIFAEKDLRFCQPRVPRCALVQWFINIVIESSWKDIILYLGFKMFVALNGSTYD